jgi:hypothetical protein
MLFDPDSGKFESYDKRSTLSSPARMLDLPDRSPISHRCGAVGLHCPNGTPSGLKWPPTEALSHGVLLDGCIWKI